MRYKFNNFNHLIRQIKHCITNKLQQWNGFMIDPELHLIISYEVLFNSAWSDNWLRQRKGKRIRVSNYGARVYSDTRFWKT